MPQQKRAEAEAELVETARRVLPGGGFGNVSHEVIIAEGRAGHVWDISGNEYIDYLLGSGPMIVGHAHPEVVEVVQQVAAKGTTFFANNQHGIRLAAEIVDAVPCAEQVVDILVAADIPDVAAASLRNNQMVRNVAEAASGQYALCRRGKLLFGLRALLHRHRDLLAAVLPLSFEVPSHSRAAQLRG